MARPDLGLNMGSIIRKVNAYAKITPVRFANYKQPFCSVPAILQLTSYLFFLPNCLIINKLLNARQKTN